MAVVSSFEDTPYTMGREGTVFFLLEYLNYLEQLNAEVRFLFSLMPIIYHIC